MKRIINFILATAVLITLTYGIANAAVPGGSDDPLISISYLTGFISNMLTRTGTMISSALGALGITMNSQLEQIQIAPADKDFAAGYKKLSLKSGGTITITMGSSVIPSSGTLYITGLSGTLLNVSADGTPLNKYSSVKPNNRYFAAENTNVTFTVYSAAAEVYVNGSYTMTASGTLPNSGFTDVSGHWAEEYINYLAGYGIVSGMGDGLFLPEYPLTRAMFVTIIGRFYGVNKTAYTSTTFSDVNMSEWYGPYVAWASEKGIVKGFEDGTFAPNDNITREQMAVIIMRYTAFCGAALPAANPAKTFSDESQISSWATDSVYAAQKAGLINGITEYTFEPKGTATRAQVCTIVYRFIRAINS